VDIDKDLLRPTDIEDLVGNSSKARKQLNWKPKMEFKDLVRNMIEHDLEQVKLSVDPFTDI
jgi:GDPmannose 4,6-dehydratase